MPLGLVLSVIAVYIMLFTGWKGEECIPRDPIAATRCSDRAAGTEPASSRCRCADGFPPTGHVGEASMSAKDVKFSVGVGAQGPAGAGSSGGQMNMKKMPGMKM